MGVVQSAASDHIYGSTGIGKSTLCMGVVQGTACDLIMGQLGLVNQHSAWLYKGQQET